MSSASQRVPPLGEERIAPGEADDIAIVTDVCLELMEIGKTPVPRQQHGKGHGCVRAQLTVDSNVHQELRHGILSTPRTFDAIARLSNGGSPDDRNRDAHGLALKLFGVAGSKVLEDEGDATTHDFIFMDHATFFIRDAREYAEFAITLRNGTRRSRSAWAMLLPEKVRPLILVAHLMRKYFLKHKAELGFLQNVRSTPPNTPLESTYWSVTPAKLGPHAVRWILRPRPAGTPVASAIASLDTNDPDRLRKAMSLQLRSASFHFDLFVQRQTDPVAMPVEDPTVAWDALAAPEYHVGVLSVPIQEFDTPHKRALGDSLSFSVWHCLPEHRPLGGINRIRRAVYEATSARRRELNAQRIAEPGDSWLQDVWDAGAHD